MKKISTKLLVWTILAAVFLVFYIYSWGTLLSDLISLKMRMNTPQTEGFFDMATAAGGITSALAVGTLGASASNDQLSFQSLFSFSDDSGLQSKLVSIFTLLFLLSWVCVGVLTVVYGWITPIPDPHSDWAGEALKENSEHLKKIYDYVSAYATAWFGMALSAVFVFLRIKK